MTTTGKVAIPGDKIEQHDRVYAEAFALIREDARGRSKTIARGPDLIERAPRAGIVRRIPVK